MKCHNYFAITIQKFGVGLLCPPQLYLFGQKYSKIVKYYYNLK